MKRLLALAFLLAPFARAGEPEVLSDEWQVVRIGGHDSGWAHTRSVRKGDAVETILESEIQINRAGAVMSMASAATSEERTEDGSILRILATQTMSGTETKRDIRFEGKKATIVTTIAGKARESKQDVGEGVVGPYRLERLLKDTGFEKGAKFKARTYAPDLGGAIDLAVTVGGEEEVELLDGKKETLVRVEVVMLGIKETRWMDRECKVWRTHVNVGGMEIEGFAASEERARKGADAPPAALPDTFANSLLAPLHQIPHPRAVDRATYRIRSKADMPDFADSRQAVEPEEGGAILLRVERKVPAEGAMKRPIADPPAELAACLAANSMVQSDEAEIRGWAEKVVGDETDAWKAARKIERWVYDHITEKSYGVGFASALEVCRDRKGDCTEHAVLLCALARAAGIPSRVVMGVTCIGNAFGGHAWTEVWIDGAWYALDGTLAQGSTDATHITFSRLTLEDAAGAEAYVGLLQGLGNLEIDPLELVIAGRTLRPADDAGDIDGDRYASRLWSISFTCPEGFEFDPAAKTTASMTASIMQLERKEGKSCEIEVEATETAIWDMFVSVDGRKIFDSVEDTTIDGRPALRVARKGMRGVIVKTELGVFTFMVKPHRGDAEAQALEALVASVDFDVK